MLRKILGGVSKFAIFCAFLIALALFSGLLTIHYIFAVGEVAVPDVIGEDTVYAADLLAEQHLKLKTVDQQFDPKVKPDHILAQDPPAGTMLKKHQVVRVILSKGAEASTIPDVVGKRWQEATRTIKQQKFRLGNVAYVHTTEAPIDHIVTQTPPPYTEASMRTAIDLLVSLGPHKTVMIMPDLVEEQMEYAMQVIGKLGLVLGKVERDEAFTEIPPNTVISQVPKPGTLIEEQNIVSLVVSGPGLSRDPYQMGTLSVEYHPLDYMVPLGRFDREVMMTVRNAEGIAEIFRQFVPPGRTITVQVPVAGETVVEIYLDGVLAEIKRITLE